MNLGFYAWSGDCDYVNLSNHFGPASNQRGIGWCYAYSASDLITYKYKGVLKGQAVSPLHIALLYNLNDEDTVSKDGGTVNGAIRVSSYPYQSEHNSLFGKGLCLSSVDAQVFGSSGGSAYQMPIKKQLYQILMMKEEYDRVRKNGADRSRFLAMYKEFDAINPLINAMDPKIFSHLMENSNRVDIGIRYIDYFCPYSGRLKFSTSEYPMRYSIGDTFVVVPKKGPSIQTTISNSKFILDLVHEQLDRNNVSSIAYYSGFLKNDGNSAPVESHASTVVGRERIKGVCHVIVRNSWGDCKNQDGEYQYSRNVKQCKDGYIWIAESQLLKNLTGVTYLK